MVVPANSTIRKPEPLVTVIAACYNHARFLNECLDSIRNQTYGTIQLIITDDCSTDGSPQLIEAWILKNQIDCVFLKHERNLGICRTLNDALAQARGKYVAQIATDDVWLPDKLEKQVPLMEAEPEQVAVLYSDALVIDEQGRQIAESFIHTHHPLQHTPQGRIQATLWAGNFIPAMTTLIRRSCYEHVGPYDEQLAFEDWDMWLRIARLYEFRYSDRISARYRIVSTSLAHGNTPRMLSAGIRLCQKHIDEKLIPDEARTHLANLLYFYAKRCYETGHPDREKALDLALKNDRKLRTRCLSLCARLSVPYKWFETLTQCGHRLASLRSKP